MQLELSYHHDFMNPEFRNTKFRATMPREFLLEIHSDLLRVIKRVFLHVKGDLVGFTNTILGF
jgi:hypothetical protein